MPFSPASALRGALVAALAFAPLAPLAPAQDPTASDSAPPPAAPPSEPAPASPPDESSPADAESAMAGSPEDAARDPAPPPAPASGDSDGEAGMPAADLFEPPDLEKNLATPQVVVPTQNVTINLITRLMQRGVLTRGDAVELIQQAEGDAAIARANAEAARAAEALPLAEESISVTYIPESVRMQMRDEIKQDVLNEMRHEKYFTVDGRDGWPSRIQLFGDLRLRYDYLSYPEGNDNTGAFPNFNAINTGAPFDTAGLVFAPQYNVDQDRNRFRIRFRLGADLDLDDGFSGGFRIATGDSNSPTSTNQSIGLASGGQGGQFSKYAIWLDRAFLKYEWESNPEPAGASPATSDPKSAIDPKAPVTPEPAPRVYPRVYASATAGRFDSPFQSTEIIFDEDLGFDGLALHGRARFNRYFQPFVTLGAFPIFNTDLNFSSNQPVKFDSTDKYLYAVQGGTDVSFTPKAKLKLAAAYYNFHNVEGRLSDPYVPLSASDAGNTDTTRPSFAQKGNTYRPLRNIIPDATNGFGTTNQWQYFGLATEFRNVALTGRLDLDYFEPVRISLVGEYIKNTAFDKEDIEAIAVNNRGPLPIGPDGTPTGEIAPFEGTDTAWSLGLKFGHPALEKRGAWQAGIAYRYIGSDAVIDGFNDSEFGGGGSNVEGWALGAAVAISPRVSLGFQWMSADEIAGPPLQSDLFQFDLRAKF
ncbi:MAG: putative porin [Verrucomicrobiales bacterium]